MADAAPTRWRPLVPPANPRASGQAGTAALVAFWRRVREGLGADDPTLADRLGERATALSGIGPEVLDVLRQPLSVPMLQALHVLATRDQTAARAVTADGGFKYVPFPYGKLKDRPNSLLSHGRVVQEFCPPERVVDELGVLLRVAASIPDDLVEVRAAWLVHALLLIHPFVDGNGRVSRLLASQPMIAVGLPPIWGELSERGAGWKDAVAASSRTDDLGPVAAMLAAHEEGMVQRLLLEAEGPPTTDDLDTVLAHDARLARVRAAWADHAAASAAAVPALLDLAADALATLGARLDPDARVVRSDEAASTLAEDGDDEGGGTLDRRAAAGAVRLDLPTRRARVIAAIGPIGASGSGALAAALVVRPRAALAEPVPRLFLVPEETSEVRCRRFTAWLERGMPRAASNVIRLP